MFCGEKKLAKAGDMLAEDAPLEVRGRDHPWVSRGGIKLDHGLTHFGFDVTGAVALDVGSSTGGFTDVLLSRGAAKVYAVDVGTNQLAWKLRQDPRVVVHEQTNARDLDASIIPEPVDIVVCDASFIGLAKVLEAPLEAGEAGREAGRAGQAAVRGGARGSREGRRRPRPRGPRARLRRGRRLGRIAGLDRAGRRRRARSPGPKAMSNSCWERRRMAEQRRSASWWKIALVAVVADRCVLAGRPAAGCRTAATAILVRRAGEAELHAAAAGLRRRLADPLRADGHRAWR